MMKQLYIKSYAVCTPEEAALAEFQIPSVDIDKTLIPAGMRRRTSLTTRMAITAASLACEKASVERQEVSSIFASLGGEIQITDALCRLLPDDNELLSPTQFHNSVHNTTAGYWSILSKCQAATTAIAAADDTFAMGLIEAYSQLQQESGDRLLVCYDELWPQYLAAPIGKIALACAFILSSSAEQAIASISVPNNIQGDTSLSNEAWVDLAQSAPAAVAIPLLQALQAEQSKSVALNIQQPIWHADVTTIKSPE